MVQGVIPEELQKVVFQIWVLCYLHERIMSSILNKNKKNARDLLSKSYAFDFAISNS